GSKRVSTALSRPSARPRSGNVGSGDTGSPAGTPRLDAVRQAARFSPTVATTASVKMPDPARLGHPPWRYSPPLGLPDTDRCPLMAVAPSRRTAQADAGRACERLVSLESHRDDARAST